MIPHLVLFVICWCVRKYIFPAFVGNYYSSSVHALALNSDRSIEVKLPALLGNYDRRTDRRTDRLKTMQYETTWSETLHAQYQ